MGFNSGGSFCKIESMGPFCNYPNVQGLNGKYSQIHHWRERCFLFAESEADSDDGDG